MFAIPKPGRTVPIPGSRKLLGPAGQNIGQVTQYWHRRVRDGDVTLSQTAPVASTTPAPTPAATAPATASPSPTVAIPAAPVSAPTSSGTGANPSTPTGSAA